MASNRSDHPLTVRLGSLSSFSYLLEDNIDLYLQVLYEGKLFETLASGYPGEDVIISLADSYAEIADMIFWRQNSAYSEALRAFPLFVGHLLQTKLALSDLYNVHRIVRSFHDGEVGGNGPEHLAELGNSIKKLLGLFLEEAYRTAIYDALQDKSRLNFDELISMAHWHYAEDEFDLFLSYARHQPVQALWIPYWLIDMDDAQRERFIAWARSYMPENILNEPLARAQQYTETEKAVLECVLSRAEHILKNPQDRRDFIIWGLSSTDNHLASAAALQLEDLSSSEWPEGSIRIITELCEVLGPRSSTNSENAESLTKSKTDKLWELLHRA